MAHSFSPIIFLPGAGGEIPNFSDLAAGDSDTRRFEALTYPGWKQYASKGFTIEALIAELEVQIVARVPKGPIQIVGYSVGGHFGYAMAVRLQAAGREIAGFCAIDSFMIDSLGPSAGWKSRALSESLAILRKGHFREFTRFIRSKIWRGMIRLAGSRLPSLIQGVPFSGLIITYDPILEKELNLRLLTRAVVPWTASLDREPVKLDAPASLLRTRSTAGDDGAWRRRCPSIKIFEIPGQHQTLLREGD